MNSRISPSWSPQHLDYKDTPLCSAFTHSFGSDSQVLMCLKQTLYPLSFDPRSSAGLRSTGQDTACLTTFKRTVTFQDIWWEAFGGSRAPRNIITRVPTQGCQHTCALTLTRAKCATAKTPRVYPEGTVGSANHRAATQEPDEAEKEGGSSDMKDGPRLVLSEERRLRTLEPPLIPSVKESINTCDCLHRHWKF